MSLPLVCCMACSFSPEVPAPAGGGGNGDSSPPTEDAGLAPTDAAVADAQNLSDVSDLSDRSDPTDRSDETDAGEVPDAAGGDDTGTDPGDGGCNGCMSPPASSCADPHTLNTFDTPGTCASDICSYTSSTKECYYGCSNGKCVDCTPDCAGKECGDDGCGESCGMCDKAPADSCTGANTVRDYDLEGTCVSNKCEYRYTERNCQYGCQGGVCKGCQPDCSGKECGDNGCGGACGSCNDPPADYCASAATLREYKAAGTCSGVSCTYGYTDKTCQWGCSVSACNPCQPGCGGKECGDDGCGGSCGGCQQNYSCAGTTCVWDGEKFEAEGAGMGHAVGRRDGDGWAADTNLDAKGYMLYGPYTTAVPAGARTAAWTMMVDNNTADTLVVVRVEVNDHALGEHVIASRDVRRNQFSGAMQYQDFSLAFSGPGAGHDLEFRVYWNDYSYVRIDKVTVR